MRFVAELFIVFFLSALSIFLSSCASSSYAAQPTLDPRAAAGKQLFEFYCSSCHSTLPDTVIVGPSLSGVAVRDGVREESLDPRAYLRQSILDPSAYLVEGYKPLMPETFTSILQDDQIDALITYLLTLE